MKTEPRASRFTRSPSFGARLVVGAMLAAAAGCSGAVATTGPADAGPNEGDAALHEGGVSHAPVKHYPSPSVCAPSTSTVAHDECTKDSDCAAGKACECANEQNGNAIHSNVCITAQCRTDADCGAGGYCSLSVVPLCGSAGVEGFYCHTPADTCADSTDCTSGGACTFTGNAWACVTAGCAG